MIENFKIKSPHWMAIWIFCKQAVVIVFSTPAALSVLSTLNYRWDLGPAIRRILQSYEKFIEVLWTFFLQFFGIEVNIRPEVGIFIFFLASPVVVTFIFLFLKQEFEVWKRFKLHKLAESRKNKKIKEKFANNEENIIFEIRSQIKSERTRITKLKKNINNYWNRASLTSVIVIFLIFGLWIYFVFSVVAWLSIIMTLSFVFSFYTPIVWMAWFVSPDPYNQWDYFYALVVPAAAVALYIVFYYFFPDWWDRFPKDITDGVFASILISIVLLLILIAYFSVSKVLEIRTPAYVLLWVFGVFLFTWLADNVLPFPDVQRNILEWLRRHDI